MSDEPYHVSRQWADKGLDDARLILKMVCGWDTHVAPEHLDRNEATDLIGNGVWHIAVRSRSYEKYFAQYRYEFTIRSRRRNGAETELAKILDGFADFMLYGFIEGLRHRYFYVLNLMAFREAINKCGIEAFSVGGEIANKDKTTFFYAFDVRYLSPISMRRPSDDAEVLS